MVPGAEAVKSKTQPIVGAQLRLVVQRRGIVPYETAARDWPIQGRDQREQGGIQRERTPTELRESHQCAPAAAAAATTCSNERRCASRSSGANSAKATSAMLRASA